MHSCFDAYCVYGVMEGDRNMALDSSWLEEHFPYFYTYASDVVRNYRGNAVYGICVGICQETGQAIASDEKKESVQRLYTILCEYCEKSGHDKPSLGYFLVVSGDYETSDQEEYVPEMD